MNGVKVLDFGLAKALDSAPAAIDSSHSPAITSPALMTGVGVLLGTAAYVAPEQAVGKPADKGSDLWAFGVVLMEMLTGHPVFAGETVTHVLAAVLKSEPDWTRLPRATSPAIRRLLRRCLEKGRRKRLDSAGAARLEIDEALAADDARADTPAWLTPSRRVALLGAAMFVLGTLASGAVAWMVKAAPAPGKVSRFPVPLPEAATMLASNAGSNLALSPDGATLVYTAFRSSGTSQLFRRDLSSLDAVPIPGTEGASFPEFSPDGQSLAFVRGSDVLTMPVAGGATTRVYRAMSPNKNPTQLSWGSTGMIVFGFTGNGDAVMQVPASGGTATRLTALDTAAGETDHRQPEMLPGGEAILFTAWSGPAVTEGLESAEIVAYIGATGERRKIIAGAGAQFVDSGHLIFVRPDGVWAVPFSSSRLETTGMPVRVLEGVLTFNTGVPQLAVASNGTLVYQQVGSKFPAA